MDCPAANFIVPDPPAGVLVRTIEKASGALMATGFIPATGTVRVNDHPFINTIIYQTEKKVSQTIGIA